MLDPQDNKTIALFESAPAFESSWAEISACSTYRYLLGRRWAPQGETVLWVMLNPSTANAELNDPTIRRCISFSQDWGFHALEVVNLFAWRARNPDELRAHPVSVTGGPDNRRWVEEAVARSARIVAGWGERPLRYHPERLREGLKWLEGKELHCIALTKDNQPRHPLYLTGGAMMQRYLPSFG